MKKVETDRGREEERKKERKKIDGRKPEIITSIFKSRISLCFLKTKSSRIRRLHKRERDTERMIVKD